MEYPKIQTIFKRDKYNIIIPGDYTKPEFEWLKDCKFRCEEKIDGCLAWDTLIQMADGTSKPISKVQDGDIVLGFDTEGNQGVKQVVVQKVTKQKRAGRWVKIKVTHRGLGKGNSWGKIVCTFDHKIWTTNRGYVEAYQLTPEDKILAVRSDLSLTPIQEQILIGKMLGDGSLTLNRESCTGSIEFGHSEFGMTKWTLQGLQELGGNIYTRVSGYGSQILVGRTKQTKQIYDKFHDWLTEEGKQVPENIFLTPISLAFWYMDDGALEHTENQEDRVRFATNGFTTTSCEHLLRALERLGIEGTIRDYKGNTICLDSENSEKLFLLVMPYICNEYHYKLPERYRDITPYLPKMENNGYHTTLVEQDILSIEEEPSSHERWDLTTETHNFFTTSGLVHNTNIRVEIHITEDGSLTYEFAGRTSRAIIPTHLLEKLGILFTQARLKSVFDEQRNCHITLYGEGYGHKIQRGGRYIKDDVGFILFDIMVGNWWLQREKVDEIARKLGIKTVPIVGYMTIAEACRFVESGFKSLIAEDKSLDAEGLVLKTPGNLLLRNGERVVLKVKSTDFRKFKERYGQISYVQGMRGLELYTTVEQEVNELYETT